MICAECGNTDYQRLKIVEEPYAVSFFPDASLKVTVPTFATRCEDCGGTLVTGSELEIAEILAVAAVLHAGFPIQVIREHVNKYLSHLQGKYRKITIQGAPYVAPNGFAADLAALAAVFHGPSYGSVDLSSAKVEDT